MGAIEAEVENHHRDTDIVRMYQPYCWGDSESGARSCEDEETWPGIGYSQKSRVTQMYCLRVTDHVLDGQKWR